jgi:hypothetical protein
MSRAQLNLSTNTLSGVDYISETGARTIEGIKAEAIAGALHVNKALASLNLSNNAIGHVGATCIADALRVNQTLTSINLRGHNDDFAPREVGTPGSWCAIFNALCENQHNKIASWDLSKQGIDADPAATKAMADYIAVCDALTSLDLRSKCAPARSRPIDVLRSYQQRIRPPNELTHLAFAVQSQTRTRRRCASSPSRDRRSRSSSKNALFRNLYFAQNTENTMETTCLPAPISWPIYYLRPETHCI